MFKVYVMISNTLVTTAIHELHAGAIQPSERSWNSVPLVAGDQQVPGWATGRRPAALTPRPASAWTGAGLQGGQTRAWGVGMKGTVGRSVWRDLKKWKSVW